MDHNESVELRTEISRVIELARQCRNEDEAAEQIVLALTQEHRTHQQQFMGALKLAIRKYAKAQYGYDLRNEAAVEWASEVAALPNSDIRFPYI